MNKRFCILILTVFLASCSKNKPADIQTIEADEATAETIFIPEINENATIDLTPFIEKVEYIKLGDDGTHILTNVDKMENCNDESFILWDESENKIFRYAKDGKFLNSIGEKGHGKNEYAIVMDVCYNPYTDIVYVWDNFGPFLMKYTLDGKFISKMKIPYYHGALCAIDSDHYGIYLSEHSQLPNEEPFYFKVADASFNELKRYDPITRKTKYINSSNKVFQRYSSHERPLCRRPGSNYIFEMRADSIIPRYRIIDEHIKNNEKCEDCFNFFETDHYNFIEWSINHQISLIIRDKRTNEIHAGFYKHTHLDMYSDRFFPIKCYDNKMYCYINPDYFDERYNNSKQLLPVIDEDPTFENLKFKDQFLEIERYSRNKSLILKVFTLK